MSDQAQGLRSLANRSRTTAGNLHETSAAFSSHASSCAVVSEPAPVHHARVLAITSGKGGVGKTNFTSNLGLAIAKAGHRVVAVDADLGLANLHVVLGITPHYTLEHVLNGTKTLAEALYSAPYGMQVLGGASGIADIANLKEEQRGTLLQTLRQLDTQTDLLLLDTGAGVSEGVLSFLNAAQEILIVTTPEPTSLTDAYATMKVVLRENPEARFLLVVNMASNEQEARAVAERLNAIAARFLHASIQYLGYVPFDTQVRNAVRSQKPFVVENPDAPAAQAIRQIAGRIVEIPAAQQRSGGLSAMLTRMQRLFVRSSV